MIILRQGQASDSTELTELIFSTAPVLLPYLFGSSKKAIEYLKQACARKEGQYSALRHTVASCENCAIGSVTLWSSSLPLAFYRQTENSLIELLSPEQLAHVILVNRLISNTFSAPTNDQLCIGHFAVDPLYQGKGIGKKLFYYTVQQALKLDKEQLVLDVDSLNDNAVNFYVGMGFTLVDESYFKPTNQTFYRMKYNVD